MNSAAFLDAVVQCFGTEQSDAFPIALSHGGSQLVIHVVGDRRFVIACADAGMGRADVMIRRAMRWRWHALRTGRDVRFAYADAKIVLCAPVCGPSKHEVAQTLENIEQAMVDLDIEHVGARPFAEGAR